MKARFVIAFVVLAANKLFGQVLPPILKTESPAKGIYRNFQEFLDNAPSIQSPFIIECKSGEHKVERGTADYRLIMLDSATIRKDVKKFWGVSDGSQIFLNEIIYGGPFNFKKVHGLGRYCYFKGSIPYNSVSSVPGGGGLLGLAAMEIDGDYPYILNINNGKVFLLDKETLGMILKKDPELQAEYEEDKGKSKKNTLLDYVIKYNSRHRNEIEYKKIEPGALTLYRRDKKEKSQPMTLRVGDTTQSSILPNSKQTLMIASDSVQICLDDDCKTFALRPKRAVYIECSWKDDDKKFDVVSEKVGKFYEHEIEVLNDRKKTFK